MTGIDELQAKISRFGITRPNRFQVELSTPKSLPNLIPRELQERFAIQCEVAQLPGKSFSTQEHRIYGPIRKFPYTATYTSSIDLSFRVGEDYKERSIFDLWQDQIMSTSTNMFNYYKEYVTDMIIHQFNAQDERIYSIKLFEAWPEAIGPIDLTAESRDTYNRQSITFAYRQWEQTDALPLVFEGETTTKKAEGGKIATYFLRGAGAFFDQLPRITGSGGTIFGSIL